jgi:Trk-type K+ transport system membrane component
METMTFDDLALLFVATISFSMIFGGIGFWIITAIRDCKEDD